MPYPPLIILIADERQIAEDRLGQSSKASSMGHRTGDLQKLLNEKNLTFQKSPQPRAVTIYF